MDTRYSLIQIERVAFPSDGAPLIGQLLPAPGSELGPAGGGDRHGRVGHGQGADARRIHQRTGVTAGTQRSRLTSRDGDKATDVPGPSTGDTAGSMIKPTSIKTSEEVRDRLGRCQRGSRGRDRSL